MTRTKTGLAAVALLCALALAGCSSLSVLQAVVDSTAAAVPILQSAGVAIPPQVPTYIAAVANCIGSQTGNPTPTQLLAISACLDKQVAPTLPPGVPQAVANIVASVIQDVINYLQKNPPPVAGARARTVKANFSPDDVAKIDAMRKKAQATVAALRKQ